MMSNSDTIEIQCLYRFLVKNKLFYKFIRNIYGIRYYKPTTTFNALTLRKSYYDSNGNIVSHITNMIHLYERFHPSIIGSSFSWALSKEGYEFWDRINRRYCTYKRNEYNR